MKPLPHHLLLCSWILSTKVFFHTFLSCYIPRIAIPSLIIFRSHCKFTSSHRPNFSHTLHLAHHLDLYPISIRLSFSYHIPSSLRKQSYAVNPPYCPPPFYKMNYIQSHHSLVHTFFIPLLPPIAICQIHFVLSLNRHIHAGTITVLHIHTSVF